MRYVLVVITACSLLTLSCSKSAKTSKVQKTSKYKDMKEQEPPPRVIIDVDAEGYTIDGILKLNKEIPILELNSSKSWGQDTLDKLIKLKTLDKLTIQNFSSENNLKFILELPLLRTLVLKSSQLDKSQLIILSDSKLSKIELINSKATGLDELKSALPKIEIQIK